MDLLLEDAQKQQAARAVGRCHGAMFFSVFGAAWFLLSAYAFGRLKIVALPIAVAAAILVLVAMRLQGRGKDAGKDAIPAQEQKRNDRMFGIVNAVTWISVALTFQILPRLGYRNLVFPAIVLIVGLHFFPMPPLYQSRANLVGGTCMVAWAILCPILFRGDRIIAFVALGAGIVLWGGAAVALKTASHLLRSNGL
jgi:hypothetical protein